MSDLPYVVGKRYVFTLANGETLEGNYLRTFSIDEEARSIGFIQATPIESDMIYENFDDANLLLRNYEFVPHVGRIIVPDHIYNPVTGARSNLTAHPRSIEGLQEEAERSNALKRLRLAAAREAQHRLSSTPKRLHPSIPTRQRLPPHVAAYIGQYLTERERRDREIATTGHETYPQHGPSRMGGRRRTSRRMRSNKRTRFRR